MTLAAILGGRKVFAKPPRVARDWIATVNKGMPVDAALALKDRLGITDAVFARLLGVSEKTLARARAAGGRLDAVTSDRLLRAARILELAEQVLEGESRAIAWLKRSQPGLGGETPISYLETDTGVGEVERLLLRIEHGVYS